MLPFPHRLELYATDIAAQAEQICAAPLPFALYEAVFIVVVAVFQMPLSVASAARHGPYGEHSPTVTLFEIRMQRFASEK